MKTKCHECGYELEFPPSLRGSEIACRECGSIVFLDPGKNPPPYVRNVKSTPPEIPVQYFEKTNFTCGNCGGLTERYNEKTSEGSGCIILIMGTCLAPFLIGIPIIIVGLVLAFKTEKYWRCLSCGAKIPR